MNWRKLFARVLDRREILDRIVKQPTTRSRHLTPLSIECLESRIVLNSTYHNLAQGDYSQNWGTTNTLLTTNDDWSQVNSVVGFFLDSTSLVGTSGATNPWDVTTTTGSTVDLVAQSASTSTAGGVHEIEASGVVALQGSGTARAPYLSFFMNAAGRQNLLISYNLVELDSTTAPTNQKFALQYRVGNSGNWTDIAAGRVDGAFTAAGNQTFTLTDVALPAAVNDQAQVEIRIMTTDASGSDAMVGIDDIVIKSSAIPDTTAPTVSSITRLDGSSSNAATVRYAVQFSESVTGINSSAPFSDFSLTTSGNFTTAPSITSITGSGASYVVTINTGAGNGTVRLDLIDDDSIIDAASNPLGGAGVQNYTTGEVYTIDKLAPALVSITRIEANPTNLSSVQFLVTFDESVTGVATSSPFNFSLVTGGSISGASITGITGTGATRTVTVNTGTGDGTLGLDLILAGSIVDEAGNALAGPFTPGEVFVVDKTPPQVLSVTRVGSSPTNVTTVDYTVTFTESVNNVTASDFSLTETGTLTGSTINSVSGSAGQVFIVSVDVGNGAGNLRLDVLDADRISDAATNQLGGSGQGNGQYLTGEEYIIDRFNPTVMSITRNNLSPSNLGQVSFTVTFSETVTSVDTTDFSLTLGGTLTGATVTDVQGSGSVRTVVVNTGTGDGNLSLNLIDDDTIADQVGNKLGGAGQGNGDFTTGESITIDKTPPQVLTIKRVDANPTRATNVAFEVEFSESVIAVGGEDFVLDVIGVTGATINDVQIITGTRWVVNVSTGSGTGTLSVDLNDINGTIKDDAGNLVVSSFTSGEAYNVDLDFPTYSTMNLLDGSPSGLPSVRFEVVFSESVTGVNVDDFTLTAGGSVSGASIANVTGSGTTWVVTANTGSGSGILRLNLVDDDSIVDYVGNPLGGAGGGNGNANGATYTLDKQLPSVSSITRLDGSPTNAAQVRFQVSFSEAVSGVDVTDFAASGLVGASVASVSSSSSSVYVVTLNTGSNSGVLALHLNDDDTITDQVGNPLGGSGAGNGSITSAANYSIDKLVPTTASFTQLDPASNSLNSVRYQVVFSETVVGVDSTDFNLQAFGLLNSQISNVSGSGFTYTITINSGTGSGTIQLSLADNDSIADLAGNPLAGPGTENGNANGPTYTIDRGAPTVLSVTRVGASPTNALSVQFTVVFNENVNGVDASDFVLDATGITGASVTSVVPETGPASSYLVTVNTGSGAGTLSIDLPTSGTGIADVAGNAFVAGYTTGETYTIDRNAPTVASITRLDPSPTNATSVRFEVVFSEQVINVAANDFTLVETGLVGSGISQITGSGSTYVVTVDVGAGDGTLSLDLNTSGNIQDLLGNDLIQGFSGGEQYVVDLTGPQVLSITRVNSNPTNAASVQFLVTFDEVITGFDSDDLALLESGIAGSSVTQIQPSGQNAYLVTVAAGSGDGTLALEVVDNMSIIDAVGNPLQFGFNEGEQYSFDRIAPTVLSIQRAGSTPTNATSVQFTVSFSEAVSGFGITDVTLDVLGITGASVVSVSPSTGPSQSYTVTVNTGSGDGTLSIDILGTATLTDEVGNVLTEAFQTGEAYLVDKSNPSVESVTRVGAALTNASSVEFLVIFSEQVIGFDVGDVALDVVGLSGASILSVSPSSGPASTYTVLVATGSGNGTLSINTLNNSTIQDVNGNNLSAPFTSGEFFTLDRSPPMVTSINRVGATPTTASSVQFLVTFDKNVSDVDADDFVLDATGISGASLTSVTGSGTSWTVTVSTGAGSGSLSVDVITSGAVPVVDAAGNSLAEGYTAGQAFVFDRTSPVVSGITRLDSNPSSANSVRFQVTFSEDVTGVNQADFSLNTSGITAATITQVSGSGSTWTVTVNTGLGSGTIGLLVVDDDSVVDSLSNPLGGTGVGNGNFALGDSYTIDRSNPSQGVKVTVSSSSVVVMPGQPVTLSVTVAPTTTGVSPTGTVSFFRGSQLLRTAGLVGGRAQFSTVSLPIGSSIIRAVYNGDSRYKTGSASLSQEVGDVPIRFVNRAFVQLTGTAVGSVFLQTWSSQLRAGLVNRTQVILAILQQPAYQSQAVRQVYQNLLQRQPSPAELSSGVARLRSGGQALLQLNVSVLASPEFIARRGITSSASYVSSVVAHLTAGIPAGALRNRLTGQLLQVASSLGGGGPRVLTSQSFRAELVRDLVSSAPGREAVIQQMFFRYLGRQADSRLNLYTGMLGNGVGLPQILASLLGSTSYLQNV
ncbi:MAG: Ig-like domain-containing protein [Gemmataceae bacterium]